ncbi:MAG TPA: hypothetical protein VGR71_04875, partial [Nitrospira sp.]|nr:hypothetical protein [Nitrospira sp.]
PHFVIDAPGGGGKIPLLPSDYLIHMDDDGALLRNYENKTFHYPQPKAGNGRELPMVGARVSYDNSDEAFASCGDSHPDRDGYSSWGNGCSGEADEL